MKTYSILLHLSTRKSASGAPEVSKLSVEVVGGSEGLDLSTVLLRGVENKRHGVSPVGFPNVLHASVRRSRGL